MCKHITLFAIAATTLATAIPALAAPSHCARDESAVFSCNVGGKVVSLCASKDIGPNSGRLSYSYGPVGKPELVHPAPGATPQSSFVYRVLPRGDYVRFERNGISYVVFSEMRLPLGDFEGIVIAQPGKKPITRYCRDGALERDGWAAVYKAKLPQDDSEFDMPR